MSAILEIIAMHLLNEDSDLNESEEVEAVA